MYAIKCQEILTWEVPMAWNHETSKQRLSDEWKRIESAKFVVKKLTREMDLNNLGLTEARAAPRPVEERSSLLEAVDCPTIVALAMVGNAEVLVRQRL